MVKRKRKTRTHVEPSAEEMSKIPKSFVMRSGNVGTSVAALVRDVRRVFEPNTASHLRERRSNRLKDFVTVAGPLGVTHFLIFNQTEKNLNLRFCRVPRGPTLTFGVVEYALAKDCLALQRHPRTSDIEYSKPPLLVLNNFNQPEKEFKFMTVMFQNMLPPIEVDNMRLNDARRVLVLNYNEESGFIDFRHYSIVIKAFGVSKTVKKVIQTNVPNLGNFEDISDYILGDSTLAESDAEDEGDDLITDLPASRGSSSHQKAVRLQELGPRLTLKFKRIDDGLT